MAIQADIEVRFWAKVCKTDTCWLWTGVKSVGYGHMWDGSGRPKHAHRLSWEIHHGPIPSGMDVLHRCDTPACVRPDHLFIGTASDNMLDAVSKGRHGGVRMCAGWGRSGIHGISWCVTDGRWIVRTKQHLPQCRREIGRFRKWVDAIAALEKYKEAAK
jgi:hypothetical protein